MDEHAFRNEQGVMERDCTYSDCPDASHGTRYVRGTCYSCGDPFCGKCLKRQTYMGARRMLCPDCTEHRFPGKKESRDD